MSAAVTPQPQGDVFDQLAAGQPAGAPASPTGTAPPSGDVFDQLAAGKDPDSAPPAASNDPGQTGFVTNDVGNRVIVPKDGEAFGDTVQRAIAYHKALPPGEWQKAIDREMAVAPEKTAETLGAAAGIGVAGPALLAAPEELGEALEPVKNLIVKKLAEQSPTLFGQEAVKATLKRYAVAAAQKALTGASWGAGAEILHSIWDDLFGKKR